MAGPNLEVIRFGFYVFFPVAMMLKFGDPEWYNTYVVPYGKKIWPEFEKTHKPPHTSSEIQEELARLKSERLASKRRDRPIAVQGEITPATGQAGVAQSVDWEGAVRRGAVQGREGGDGHLV